MRCASRESALPTSGSVLVADGADRMFAHLPRVFRNRDATGDLARLLGVLQGVLFTGTTLGDRELLGLEQYIEEIQDSVLANGSAAGRRQGVAHARPVPALACRVARLHTACAVSGRIAATHRCRHCSADGLRGTKDYLVRLLELCFGQEVAHIHVDDRPHAGFTVGGSQLGVDTRLAVSRPFCFRVAIERRNVGTDRQPCMRARC